ncbi:MAG: ABC-F family ATP-binding cassette domain-containing protein [Acidimicrobiia bacterium]|nr:ABC-F family ATP-binding cassette domain-containing protein [Acidimicrobiia bacterium]
MGAASAEVGLDTHLLGQPLASLSGGEAARVRLAALLLSRFDLYLLDEPTNDLDLAGLNMLERWVLSQAAGMMIVSHDRRFLERVATSVAEIDHHAHTVELFGGGWQSFIDERERARQHAIERYENYDSQRRSLAARAQRQREWTQQGRSKVTKSDESDKHIRNFKTNETEKLAARLPKPSGRSTVWKLSNHPRTLGTSPDRARRRTVWSDRRQADRRDRRHATSSDWAPLTY